MKALDYLELSKFPVIKIINLEGRLVGTSRPQAEKLEQICRGDICGSAEFEDTFLFKVDELTTVGLIELWYGGTLVAMRVLPDIYLEKGDTLRVTWTLVIFHGRVRSLVISV